MTGTLVEPIAPEAVPVGVVAVKAAEVVIPDKITDIAQLPSIWKLEQNVEWLIDEMIPVGSITLLTSESGTGKTWVAYAIAGAVARGEPFAGHAVKQRSVVYLDGENPLCIAKQRLWDLGVWETPDLNVWGGWIGDAPPGPDSSIIVEYARQHRPLLIWDSLIEFHDGDEQSAKETRDFMKYFRALSNAGATVLVLHHTGKTDTSQEYRGSSDIKAAVDMAYVLKPEFSLYEGIHLLTLRNFKSRYAPEKDFGLEFVRGKGFVGYAVPGKRTAADAMPIVVDIVAGNPGSNQSQIVALAQRSGISKHQVEKCLQNGPFVRRRGNRNEWLYTAQIPNLPPPIEEGNREIEPSHAEVVA